MGMKNSSGKSNLLKREGFYVVLFLCLCVVAVLTVYISKTGSLKNNQEIAKNQVAQVEEKLQDAEQVNNSVAKQKDTSNKKEDVKDKENKEKETTKSTSTKKVAISLINPVNGEVSKKFSNDELQHTKALDIWETHEGIDINCSLGSDVKSALGGKVVDIYNDNKAEKTLKSGFGVTVVIENENGYRTVYSNLAENLKVKKGDSVKAGDVIGSVGDTSVREDVKVDGSHLHFSLLEKKGNDYKAVDPTGFLKK